MNKLPSGEAQDWFDELTHSVRAAQARQERLVLEAEFGHSQLSMARAHARGVYNSTGLR